MAIGSHCTLMSGINEGKRRRELAVNKDKKIVFKIT